MTPEQLTAAKNHVEEANMLSGVDPCVARALVAEVERLQRIEAAARAYRVAVVNGGINAAEDELFAALDAAEGGAS